MAGRLGRLSKHRPSTIFGITSPKSTPTDEVYQLSNWNTLTFYYKLRLIKLFHSVFIVEAPAALSYLTNNSISYRGAIPWNTASTYFTGQFIDFYRKVKKDFYFKELDFSAQSAQSLPRHYQDFKCFWIFYILCLNCCNQLYTCKYANSFQHFPFLKTDWLFSFFFFFLLLFTMIVVFCKLCYHYFNIVSYCNYFHTTPQALSFKPYRD